MQLLEETLITSLQEAIDTLPETYVTHPVFASHCQKILMGMAEDLILKMYPSSRYRLFVKRLEKVYKELEKLNNGQSH